MQFKNLIIISIFVGLCAFALGTRIMNMNSNSNKAKTSVFAPENFIKKDADSKLEDLIDKRIAAKNMKIRNPKNKFVKPQIIASNSTDPIPEIIYNSNFNCNDGEYFDNLMGKCVKLGNNNTEVMITAHPTRAASTVSINQNTTIVPCLNKTENKYDDKIVNLTFIPDKEAAPKIHA